MTLRWRNANPNLWIADLQLAPTSTTVRELRIDVMTELPGRKRRYQVEAVNERRQLMFVGQTYSLSEAQMLGEGWLEQQSTTSKIKR